MIAAQTALFRTMINTQRKDTLQILRDSFGLDLGVDPDKSTPVDLRI